MGIYKEIKKLLMKGCPTDTAMDIAAIAMSTPWTKVKLKSTKHRAVVTEMLKCRDNLVGSYSKLQEYLAGHCLMVSGNFEGGKWFLYKSLSFHIPGQMDFGHLDYSSLHVGVLNFVTLGLYPIHIDVINTPIGRFVIDELIQRIPSLDMLDARTTKEGSSLEDTNDETTCEPDKTKTLAELANNMYRRLDKCTSDANNMMLYNILNPDDPLVNVIGVVAAHVTGVHIKGEKVNICALCAISRTDNQYGCSNTRTQIVAIYGLNCPFIEEDLGRLVNEIALNVTAKCIKRFQCKTLSLRRSYRMGPIADYNLKIQVNTRPDMYEYKDSLDTDMILNDLGEVDWEVL